MKLIIDRIEELKIDIKRHKTTIAENPIENKGMKELLFSAEKSLAFNKDLLSNMQLTFTKGK
jgi:hypothetical protein